MNRRNLFKGMAGAAAALILPPTLAENAEAGKRYWALGAMPQSDLLSWKSDVVPNAVRRLGDIGKDELVFYREFWDTINNELIYTHPITGAKHSLGYVPPIASR